MKPGLMNSDSRKRVITHAKMLLIAIFPLGFAVATLGMIAVVGTKFDEIIDHKTQRLMCPQESFQSAAGDRLQEENE